jgi:hypothetical protein
LSSCRRPRRRLLAGSPTSPTAKSSTPAGTRARRPRRPSGPTTWTPAGAQPPPNARPAPGQHCQSQPLRTRTPCTAPRSPTPVLFATAPPTTTRTPQAAAFRSSSRLTSCTGSRSAGPSARVPRGWFSRGTGTPGHRASFGRPGRAPERRLLGATSCTTSASAPSTRRPCTASGWPGL